MQKMTEVVVKYWDIMSLCDSTIDLSSNASQNSLERILTRYGLKYMCIENAQDIVCTLNDSKIFFFNALKNRFEYVLRESKKE